MTHGMISPSAIKRIRHKLKLTQIELAHRLRITVYALRSYETAVEKQNHRRIPDRLSRRLLRMERNGVSS